MTDRTAKHTVAISGKAYDIAVRGTSLEAVLPAPEALTKGRGTQYVWVDLPAPDRIALLARLEGRGVALAEYGTGQKERLDGRSCLQAAAQVRRMVSRSRAGLGC